MPRDCAPVESGAGDQRTIAGDASACRLNAGAREAGACRPVSQSAVNDNVFIKAMDFVKAGDRKLFHKHAYDHLTLIIAGALEIRCDGKVGRFRAPHLFMTPKDGVHQFIALEDHTLVSCIHALRDPDKGDDIIPPEIDRDRVTYILWQRNEAVMREIAHRNLLAGRGLSDGYILQGDEWQPDQDGWCASRITEAVCANTRSSCAS